MSDQNNTNLENVSNPAGTTIPLLLAFIMTTAAITDPDLYMPSPKERSRHKGGKRKKKKTWIEKQQARHGWEDR